MMDLIRQWQGLIIFGLNCLFGFLLWLTSRTLPSKADIAALHNLIEKQNRRIDSLEQSRRDGPTRRDIGRLRLEMERSRGTMQTFKAEIDAARELFSVEISGVRELVVRTERLVGLHTEHQLAQHRDRS